MIDSLRQAQYGPRFEYSSTPRLQILLRAFISGAALVGFVLLMDRLGIRGGGPGLIALFLMIATVALFILSLRRRRTVILDPTNLTLRCGGKVTLIPWRAFARSDSELRKQLKLENVMGWRRLHIKVQAYGINVSTSLDQIFGVGLPVPEIAARSWEAIQNARR